MQLLALLALATPATAAPFFQDTVQGGVAVDASAVSTPYDGSSTWYSGPDFDVDLPATATVTEVYVVLDAKSSGFPSGVASRVRVNGVQLSSATSVASGTLHAVYELDPTTFGITGAGSYGYGERGSADSGYHGGSGVSGATLFVVYEDSTLTGARHITLGAHTQYASTSVNTETITGLPTAGTTGEALLSVTIGWECSNEQDGSVYWGGSLIASGVGGRDDSAVPSLQCSGDWNSLHTAGSFGFDGSTDAWVGVGGDDPDSEPSGGTSTNSRLSDELWAVSYAETGSATLGYRTSSPDSWINSYALVIELDQDEDGIRDADDNCPSVSNPSQGDADGDGDGDACDTCTDADGDGYGDPAYAASTCDADCDDTDASITVGDTYWLDRDGDGFGDVSSTTTDCSLPSGYADNDTDCDDGEATTNPGADETCDGVDNDCDGAIDEDSAVDATTWYADTDSDGFGDASVTDVECNQPSGYVADNTDCDDTVATTWPGADETCDGVDNDCDGTTDEDSAVDAVTWYADSDGDSYGDAGVTDVACSQPSGYVADNTDCDDAVATTYPGADEYCNGADDDCDGTIDEGDAVDATTWYLDSDGDGYGDPTWPDDECTAPSSYVADDTDCDDGRADVFPGAPEVAYDGIDQDCNGSDLCDSDADGFDAADCGGTDCDDEDALIHPDAAEIWYDGVDQDCDEASDYDRDGDGFDSASYGGEDCDDARDDVYPGAPDAPYDGDIQDCDGSDEYDADGDGFDAAEHGGDDCDDAASDVNPGAGEAWYDGVDQDCDGNDDDQDQDGFAVDEDCDDTDAESYPDNGFLDEDCDETEVDSGGLEVGGLPGNYAGGACGGGKAAGSLIGLGLLFGALARRRLDD